MQVKSRSSVRKLRLVSCLEVCIRIKLSIQAEKTYGQGIVAPPGASLDIAQSSTTQLIDHGKSSMKVATTSITRQNNPAKLVPPPIKPNYPRSINCVTRPMQKLAEAISEWWRHANKARSKSVAHRANKRNSAKHICKIEIAAEIFLKSEYEATLKVPTNVPKPISQVATPTSESELNANNRNSKTKANENFIAKAARQ